MRNVMIGFVALLGSAAVGRAQEQNSPAAADGLTAGQTEIRILVFDRHWRPLGIKSANATLDVWAEGGSKRTYKLEAVTRPEGAKGEGQEHAKMHAWPHGKILGQVRDMDPLHVALVVCARGAAAGAGGEGAKEAEPGKSEGHKHEGEGQMHAHGVSYLRAVVPDTDLENPKSRAINFEAEVNFTMGEDTQTVRGFQYPEGCIQSSLERFVDYGLKDIRAEAKLDPDRAKHLSHKIQATLSNLPPLSFKSPEEKTQFDNAVNECRETSVRLAGAQGKDLATVADECREKCKEVINRAKGAQGALTAE